MQPSQVSVAAVAARRGRANTRPDYKKKRDAKQLTLSFSQQISNFFHGPENRNCEAMDGRNGCDQGVLCDDKSTHPAAFLILNSMGAINGLNWNLYDAVRTAHDHFSMGTFSDTFAPIDADDSAAKIVLDVLSMAFSVAVSPMWNSALKGLTYFKNNPNTLGTIKDMTNPIVTNSLTIVKDTTTAGQTITNTNDLTDAMKQMIDAFERGQTGYLNNLFNGSDASIDQLHALITDGKFLEGGTVTAPASQGQSPNNIDAADSIMKAIYASLIPLAWPKSNRHEHPFVMTSDKPCDFKGSPDQGATIDDDTANKNSVCYNGKLYYLVAAGDGPNQDCDGGDGMAISCRGLTFGTLSGVPTMDGKAWAGITKEDIAIGAINTNGQLCGAAAPSITANIVGGPPRKTGDAAIVEDVIDNGVRAACVVTGVPVCSGDEAMTNWGNQLMHGYSKNYPCN